MRRVLAWAGAVLIGLLLGLGSALATVEIGRHSFDEQIGPWAFNRAAGSSAAGPYTRAMIAREGLLALSSDEAIYFNLERDEHGRALQEGCIYELAGRALDARWWSITLYAPDNFLARNSDHAASIDATRVQARSDGGWTARISPVRGEAVNWLSSREARKGFSLTLRLYNTPDGFRSRADDLPTLRTLSCPGDAP